VVVALAVACAHAQPVRPKHFVPVRKGPCFEGMALLEGEGGSRFCVDRWEASLAEITADGEQPFSPYETPEGHVVRALSVAGVVPQGYISRDQADLACKASAKRLCTEDEWQTACRGAASRAFPYGDAREKGACNDSGLSPLHVFYGETPATYRPGPMNDPRLNQQPNTVAKTGAFDRCQSASGVFDMVGNLHEWVMSPRPTFRGGYFLDTHLNGDGCAYRTTAHAAAYHDYSTGFRCCADPSAG
jgi:formylglycine-generating enzyme required for sulfatase activity